MLTTVARRVGGSVMVALPRPILKLAGAEENQRFEVGCEDGRITLTPSRRKRVTLDELLARCDLNEPLERTAEDRGWLEDGLKGAEVI